MVRDYAHRGACGIRRILKSRPSAAITRRFVYNILFLHGIFAAKSLWTAAWPQVTLPAAGTGLGDFPMRREKTPGGASDVHPSRDLPMRREKTRRISPVHGPVPCLGRGRGSSARTGAGSGARAGAAALPESRPGPACSLAGGWRHRHAGAACGSSLARGAQDGLLTVDACGPRRGRGKGPAALVRRLRPQAVAPGRQTKAPALAGASHLWQTGRCARADDPGPGRRCPPV